MQSQNARINHKAKGRVWIIVQTKKLLFNWCTFLKAPIFGGLGAKVCKSGKKFQCSGRSARTQLTRRIPGSLHVKEMYHET